MKKEIKVLIAGYVVSGILAFGHCSEGFKCEEESFKITTCYERKTVKAVIAAIWNPLYWSVVAFEKQ